MIASDHVIIPLAPDLFSLQGLKNVGPTLTTWRKGWKTRLKVLSEVLAKEKIDITLPSGKMEPAGYVIMRHSVRLSRPVQAYDRWIRKVPAEYIKSIFPNSDAQKDSDIVNKDYCLAHLKDYRSLMPLAQESGKPMFMLKPADGAIGAHQSAVSQCYQDFKELTKKIITACNIPNPNEAE